jgi:hypothetical protein
MPRDIRFFGITGVILFICGIVMVYLSGKITPDILNATPVPTPKPAITAIVITQTRVPHNPWQGIWNCQHIDELAFTITVDGNFYTIVDNKNNKFVAVLTENELQIEDGRVMRLNSQENMIIVKTSTDASYFCNISKTPTPTP